MGLETVEYWENDSIDLNIRHYIGSSTDVIKKVKSEIEAFLSSKDATQLDRQIYSAIYNALIYYTTISYIQPAEFDTEGNFLSSTIDTFNEDLEYLSDKYDSPNPLEAPVINFSARIKSPVSFMEKVKEKVSEYLEHGKDFGYFNESLRDLIGARVVINPPEQIKQLGPQAECEYLYKIFYDLMRKHGINEINQENLEPGNFRFMDVNTRHSPQKQQKIRERLEKEPFKEAISNDPLFYIPTQRIPQVEQDHISRKLKDYVMYPKSTGYQSLHVCIVPDYSDTLESQVLPSCIIKPKSNDYYIEYQFRTTRQNNFAEYGIASHKTTYKPYEKKYHRLAVPSYIEIDNPCNISYSHTKKPISKSPNKKLKLRNFAESYLRFYGHSFATRFGITLQDLRNTFSTNEIDEILAGLRTVKLDTVNNTYYTEPSTIYVPLTDDQKIEIGKMLISGQDKTAAIKILEKLGITDVSKTTKHKVYRVKPGVQVVSVKKQLKNRDYKKIDSIRPPVDDDQKDY